MYRMRSRLETANTNCNDAAACLAMLWALPNTVTRAREASRAPSRTTRGDHPDDDAPGYSIVRWESGQNVDFVFAVACAEAVSDVRSCGPDFPVGGATLTLLQVHRARLRHP